MNESTPTNTEILEMATEESARLNVSTEDEPEAEAEPTRQSLWDAVLDMAGNVGRVAKKTKTSENTVLQIFSFYWQQAEKESQLAEQAAIQAMAAKSGQEQIDLIAAQEEAKRLAEMPEANEVIEPNDG